MSYMALWFGGLTSSAFLYGVGLGMWMYPPLTWTVSPQYRRARLDGPGAEDGNSR
jgi:hypothetical protein